MTPPMLGHDDVSDLLLLSDDMSWKVNLVPIILRIVLSRDDECVNTIIQFLGLFPDGRDLCVLTLLLVLIFRLHNGLVRWYEYQFEE
jgi:hypothetical protein